MILRLTTFCVSRLRQRHKAQKMNYQQLANYLNETIARGAVNPAEEITVVIAHAPAVIDAEMLEKVRVAVQQPVNLELIEVSLFAGNGSSLFYLMTKDAQRRMYKR